MFTRLSLSIVSIILLGSLAGCGSNSTNIPAPTSAAGNNSEIYTTTNNADNYQMLPLISGKSVNVELDAHVDGSTQQLKAGEIIAVSLESNITTGYSWYAAISDPKVVVQLGESQYQGPAENSGTPMLGAGGSQTFFFQAVEAGSATITMKFVQNADQNATPEKTISFMVEVK